MRTTPCRCAIGIGEWPPSPPLLLLARSFIATAYPLFHAPIARKPPRSLNNVTGAQNGILGWAAPNNRTSLSTVRGDLTVYLQIPASRGPPFPAPYDVILLGPKTYGEFGAYEYAVVSDPLELTLFVLARNYEKFFAPDAKGATYNSTVIEFLQSNGFVSFLDTPLPTVQAGCAEYSETDLWTCDVHDVNR